MRRPSATVPQDEDPLAWLADVFVRGVPEAREKSVVRWGERFVKFPGSALSSNFDSSETPWVREIIEFSGDGFTRRSTFVKPVQSGGSSAGEVVLCHRVSTQTNGDIQYNWQHDIKAGERFGKRIDPILRACGPVMKRAPADKNKWHSDGLIMFPHLNLTVQGVFTDGNVASDSIRFQINEEVHDREGGWAPGRLAQAYGRLTAYTDSFVFNISNAGYLDDELHVALKSGTHQHWSVKCPGCGLFHILRTAWDPKRPDLGGLRYDADECKRGEFDYDYNKLASTIRYQMPCGYQFGDDPKERKELSQTGKYSDPTNPGAPLTDRSCTLEAVSVHYIPFISLIQQKHEALKAYRYGNPLKYSVYVRERECRFWDPNDRPFASTIVISSDVKKSREGLRNHPGFQARMFALDKQAGSIKDPETPFPHWYLVIRDIAREENLIRTQLVYEGKIESDGNVIAVLDEHECDRRFGCADSGDMTREVYQFCYHHGINAIKGGKSDFYVHPNGARRIFDPERPLHLMIPGAPPKYDYINVGGKINPHPDEPLFWIYSRKGIFNQLTFLRSAPGVKWESPSDVSELYKKAMDSWELTEFREKDTNAIVRKWVQVFDRDDFLFCEAYIGMQMEMAGYIGAMP